MANTEASKIEEILETLNHAISIHTKAAIQDLPFNKSELVKITDISNAANGEYKVWNGSATYTAYSEKTDYEKGAQVYVTILNNDTSNRKLIIGLYQNSDNSIVNYKNPLSGYLPLTGNILDKQFEASIYDEDGNLQRKEAKGSKLNGYENEISLLGNYDGVNGLGSREIDIYHCSDLFLVDNDEHFAGYKYMGISGNFKVDFRPYNVIKGDYGIKVYLKTLIKDDVLKTAVDKEFEYRLSVKEMLGSVYDAKTTYFPQGILINVANVAYIYDIRVSVFQDGGFKINEYVDGELENMPYNFYNEYSNSYQLLNNNIFIKDISVQFGNDIPDTDNLIEIKSKNGLYYDSAQTDALNQKNLYILWTHLNEDTGKFNKIQNPYAELNQHFQIHWFKRILYKPSEYIDLSTSQLDIEDIEATLDAYEEWLEDMSDETKIAQLVQSYNLISGTDYFIVEQNNSIQLTSAGLEKVNNAKSAFEDTLEQMEYTNLAGPLWEEIFTGVLDDTSSFELDNFSPDIRKNETTLKVIVEIGPVDSETNKFLTKDFDYKLLESEEFVLLNTRDVSNAISDDVANALKITCLDNSQGKYFIYNDTTGELLNRNDASRIREWGISCISPITGEDYLSGNEIILWKIPKNDTMIVFNKRMIDDEDFIEIDDEDFIEKNDEIFSIINESYDDNFYYIRRNTDAINWCAALDDNDNYNIQNGDWDISNEEDEIEEIADPYYLLELSDENATIVDDTFYQRIAYSLERYYIKSKTNNTITCYVIKNNVVFKDSLNLEFGQHSTSGSDYLFTIGLGSKIIEEEDGKWTSIGPMQSALTLNDDKYCEIIFELYNSKNEKIDLTSSQKNDIISLWVDPIENQNTDADIDITGYYSGLTLDNNNNVSGNAINLKYDYIKDDDHNYDRVAVKVKELTPIDNVSGIILQAKLTQDIEDSTTVFKQYLPLHIRENDDLELNGTDCIVYDDKGTNPSCFNDAYKLNNKEEYSFEIVINDSNLKNNNNESLPDPIKFYPKIDEKNKLLPNPIYVEDLSKNIYIRASKVEGQDKEIYYSFPLLIIKNKYNIPAYNDWINSTPINKGVEITGASVAAGHRDEAGSLFTGFVIGDVCKTAEEVVTTGLFAYNEGTQTFGLDTEGKLVLGAQDEGQITMNGSSGLIQSAANIGPEHENSSGVRIDLKNSRIDLYGIDTRQKQNYAHISLNSKSDANKDDPYFLITTVEPESTVEESETNSEETQPKEGKKLIYINDDSYYLQSANYDYDKENKVSVAGTKLDLQNGHLTTVDIAATGGIIGGWTINADKLSAGSGEAKILITPQAIMGGDAKLLEGGHYSASNGWYIAANGTAYIPIVLTANTKVQTSDEPVDLSNFIAEVALGNLGITPGSGTLTFSKDINMNAGTDVSVTFTPPGGEEGETISTSLIDNINNTNNIIDFVNRDDDDTRTIFGETNSLEESINTNSTSISTITEEIANIHAQIDGSEDVNNPDIMDRLEALEASINDILIRLTALENS